MISRLKILHGFTLFFVVSMSYIVIVKLKQQQIRNGPFVIEFPDQVQLFSFTMMPKSLKCGGLKQLVIVQSSPSSFDSRMGIRHTWASRNESILIQNGHSLALFLLGSTTDPNIQKDIDKESSLYNDIVQYSAVDSYRALVYKSLVMLKFHDLHWPAWVLIKVDEDVLINIDEVQRRLEAADLIGTPFIAGLVAEEGKIPINRRKGHKWYISENQLPGRFYPKYAKGLGYMISRQSTPLLFANTKNRPLIPIEDAYVTGLLAVNTSIRHVNMHGYIYDSVLRQYWCFDGRVALICAHAFKGEAQLRNGWKIMKEMEC